jgi:hypothetical protein
MVPGRWNRRKIEIYVVELHDNSRMCVVPRYDLLEGLSSQNMERPAYAERECRCHLRENGRQLRLGIRAHKPTTVSREWMIDALRQVFISAMLPSPSSIRHGSMTTGTCGPNLHAMIPLPFQCGGAAKGLRRRFRPQRRLQDRNYI